MIERLCSDPPHTFGMFRPASRPTSTNLTGEVAAAETAAPEIGAFGMLAASTTIGRFHLHNGVANASTSSFPSKSREEPRKPRRGRFIGREVPGRALSQPKCGRQGNHLFRVYFCLASSARYPRKITRHNSSAFFHRDDSVDGHIRQPIHLAAQPRNFKRIDLAPFSQPKMDPWIAGRHVAHPAF